MPKHTIIDVNTQEIETFDLSGEALEEYKANTLKAKEEVLAMQELQKQKQLLLDKLGITAEEARLLFL